MAAPVFLTATGPLRGDDAVAAILIVEDGRYLMQLRDPLPRIFYPDHWGCFGGAVNPGEAPHDALRRELAEELSIDIHGASEFTRFDFDFSTLGQRRLYRIFYEVRVSVEDVSRMVLNEGAEMRLFSGMDILQQPRVTPYDAFAIWLHYRRLRFEEA